MPRDDNTMAPALADLEAAAEIPIFSALEPSTLELLMRGARVTNLHQGQTLFRQGDAALAFFVIVDGWIKLYRVTPAGDEAVLSVLTRGESLGEAVTSTPGRYPASACAVTRSRVMVIAADHAVNCIRQMPDIAIAMMASTSMHLYRLAQRVEQLTAQSALQRVADFLSSLSPCTHGPCTITLPYDKSLIAGRLGLKPESLSRIFAKLRSLGVEVRASEVVVSEVAQLRSLVAEDRIKTRPMVNGTRREALAVSP